VPVHVPGAADDGPGALRQVLVSCPQRQASPGGQGRRLAEGLLAGEPLVAAHVISYDRLGPRELAGYTVRGRFLSSRINAIALARYQALTAEELLALLMARLEPRGLPAALGCRVALVECVIHHQDVRRALGRPRVIPPERLVTALRWAMIGPDIGGLWRARGVWVVATDLGFAAGAGPEVLGPAEALLMTVAGRRGIARELSCPGQRKLASRVDRG
jgi:uncharacterized protein (TIGR03083 family)